MKRLFGVSRKDAPAKPSLEDAQGRMEARGDKLDDRLRHIDDELSKIAVEIKRAQGPSKQRLTQKATMLLKQRKAYDTHRSQLYQQQFTLDQLQFTTETVRDTKDQIAVMKDATKGLRKEFKKMDISEISKLHDEMDDLMRDSNDIQDILGEAYGDVEDFDDEEVAAELDDLAGQVALESDSSYLDVALKHSIPKSSLPNNKRSESDGLKGEEATDVHRLEQQLGL